jgi:AraC-like DNA-binding protein
MWSVLVITCLLFQTTVAVYLVNIARSKDDLDRNLRTFLVLLLVHLATKLLLLAVFQDFFLYTEIPTGFGLAYGPLLWVTAKSYLGKPLSRRMIGYHFLPFLVFSLLYLLLIITAKLGWISPRSIVRYASGYEWLVIFSLYGYPLYTRYLLQGRDAKGRLLVNIANVLVLGMTAGVLLSLLHRTVLRLPGFDLRLLPYICFSTIPVLILRYRLQGTAAANKAIIAPVDNCHPVEDCHQVEEILAEAVAIKDRRYEKSGLDSSRLDEYSGALMVFMEKSRIYLDPDLSLEELASRMKMPRHHLTQLLNDRLMKNFYSFINEYRIGVAIARLDDPGAEVNILSLAFDCGFNSRSSFNNYFKKITGCTPSAYRKRKVMRTVGAGPVRVGARQ